MPDLSRPPPADATGGPYAPEERFLIAYWDVVAQRWLLADQHADRDEAVQWRDLYRHELGRRRVRLLHTADGT